MKTDEATGRRRREDIATQLSDGGIPIRPRLEISFAGEHHSLPPTVTPSTLTHTVTHTETHTHLCDLSSPGRRRRTRYLHLHRISAAFSFALPQLARDVLEGGGKIPPQQMGQGVRTADGR